MGQRDDTDLPHATTNKKKKKTQRDSRLATRIKTQSESGREGDREQAAGGVSR